jgi:Zn-dependent M32 family carboxypeptidase
VANAKTEVANATQDLKEARREVRTSWQENWVSFKRDNDKTISENERHIIDLRREVNDIDAPYRAKYTARIDNFERGNIDLRDRVNNCKDEGDVSWETFKKDVKREADELDASRKDIIIKNS